MNHKIPMSFVIQPFLNNFAEELKLWKSLPTIIDISDEFSSEYTLVECLY